LAYLLLNEIKVNLLQFIILREIYNDKQKFVHGISIFKILVECEVGVHNCFDTQKNGAFESKTLTQMGLKTKNTNTTILSEEQKNEKGVVGQMLAWGYYKWSSSFGTRWHSVSSRDEETSLKKQLEEKHEIYTKRIEMMEKQVDEIKN